jgi:DNA-binding MarR family transcriptional regulator
MAVSKTAGLAKRKRPVRALPQAPSAAEPIRLGDLADFLGYSLKRAQLRIFDDFIGCVAPLQLTPAQFSVLMLVETNPGRNQTEIASTLGILRPNFVALLDELESRDLCVRDRSSNDRRSHILRLTEKGRAVLVRARKLIEARHEARLRELLGEDNRDLLLAMLGKIAREF